MEMYVVGNARLHCREFSVGERPLTFGCGSPTFSVELCSGSGPADIFQAYL